MAEFVWYYRDQFANSTVLEVNSLIRVKRKKISVTFAYTNIIFRLVQVPPFLH